ncbi:FUSC family protein [Saccharothrix sp. ST-888]|uniref:FUSC family protein n=1 Tax=Saccharothrix sp. ST-888 TaxID=1427391 RepID=UPI000698D544|nr:FUSC family protein [Saccharothrix sp. ST-888]
MASSPHGRGRGGRPVRSLRPGVLADPSAGAVARNAARVTLAACAGFYPCLYVLHQPVTATYALFAAVAMGALSRIPGTGRQRAGVIARCLPIGWVLVTAGTLLAISTWAAVVGMLVVSFVLAFAAVAGPRPTGAAPGLHLLYILPCFPPFAPETLGQRLAGATVGMVLLVAADMLLFRDPPPVGYRVLLADATAAATACAQELAGGSGPDSGAGSGAGAAAELRRATRERADEAGEALRPDVLPPAERPAGPGPHDRALAHAGGAVRQLLARLLALPPPAGRGQGAGPGQAVGGQPDGGQDAGGEGHGPFGDGHEVAERRLLGSIGAAVGRAAEALRAAGPVRAAPPASALDGALADFRHSRVGGRSGPLDRAALRAAMLRQAALLEAGEAARTLLGSIAVATCGPDRAELPEDLARGPLWFARVSTRQLWVVRLTGNLSGRSVYFQNAVRTSIGLAAARAVTGIIAIPHGFWAMLAALTLTRTSTAQTGATVRRALVGTLLGALAAAGLLVIAGQHQGAYAVVLPVVMLAAFLFGPLLGVGWAQGLFTVVVSTVFAQLAPASWQLAEVRFLAVLIGSLIGLLCGLFAWPRGVRGELRRDVAGVLRTTASTITDTVLVLTGRRPDSDLSETQVVHTLTLAETSFAQCQSELDDPQADEIDWQAALIAGHHALRGSDRLLADRAVHEHLEGGLAAGAGSFGERRGDGLRGAAAHLAGEYLALAERLDPAERAPAGSGHSEPTARDPAGLFARTGPRAAVGRLDEGAAAGAPAELVLLFDTGVWLQGLALDLGRIRTPPHR